MQHPLTPVLARLLDALNGSLPEDALGQVRDLLDANQPELALEWLVDALAPSDRADPQLHQLLLQLATQLGIADSIRERLEG
ncbi:MAG: hypothetical protein IPJ65_42555 [Archangiaceae bacterium]|nr:hypothetical protein [Archangiaceae bacterium]